MQLNQGIKRVVSSLLFLLMMITTPVVASELEDPYDNTMRARVLTVEDRGQSEVFFETQWVTLEIYSGPLNGEIVTVENHLSDNPVYDVPVKPGDRVLVVQEMLASGDLEIYIIDYVRDMSILWILGLFLLLLLVIGRWKGLKTILTLAFTFFLIIRVLLPGMLKGYPPILMTIGVSLLVTLTTILLIDGVNVKSISAVIGITGGLMAAGVVMFIAGSQVRLTGLSSEEAIMLMYIPQEVSFDFRDLLFAGIIMGALGAVMDVGVSIASAITEIHRVNPAVSSRQLMRSGMNVGRDIMTTMSNTLILAYTGAALPLMLLFMAYDTSIVRIMNLDMIATEILRALSGSIGLLLTIPLTVVVTSLLLKRTDTGAPKSMSSSEQSPDHP
ncbi:YibE/F family protein [Anoxynatronum sibiricum]|uniref:YibE/F family protein n=1 Tax=Anoxynatronum sibiricum TaxID=210623 RepID=A0ABU9VRH3_9CLOT